MRRPVDLRVHDRPGGVTVSRVARAIACALSVVALAACGESYRGEPLRGPFPPAATPGAGAAAPPAAAASEAADGDLERLVAGRVAFDRHCDKCHPGGSSGLAPAINNKPLPGFLLRFQVRNGMGAMPAFNADVLPDPELDALVDYLLALRAHGDD